MQGLRLLGFGLLLAAASLANAAAASLEQLRVTRADDGVYLSAVVGFELPPVVEDALVKGVPLFFVVEADIYRDRWYWTNRRVSSATRTMRLAFQPLTRKWRVNVVAGLINSSAGLRATLNQNYDSLPEAMAAVQRLPRWRIADRAELEADAPHKVQFRYRLDLSQLPRPFQIGVAGQREWTIEVSADEPLSLDSAPPEASRPEGLQDAKPGLGPGLGQVPNAPGAPIGSAPATPNP